LSDIFYRLSAHFGTAPTVSEHWYEKKTLLSVNSLKWTMLSVDCKIITENKSYAKYT